jgi:integrase
VRKKLDLRQALVAVPEHRAADITFGELARAYCATTTNGDDLRLVKFIEAWGDRPAWSIRLEEIDTAVRALQAHGYAASTINRDTSTLGTVYRWAKERRLAPAGFVSPTLNCLRFPEEPRRVTFTAEQIERLRTRALAFRDRRFGALVNLLADTGARKSELLERVWADFDLDAMTITLRAEVTKTGKPRILYYSEATRDLLRRVFPQRNPLDMPFASRTRGKPVDFKKAWASCAADVGLAGMHMHDLRHNRAAELLRQNVSIGQAAQVIGNGAKVLELRYGHLADADLEAAARATMGRAPKAPHGARSPTPAATVASIEPLAQ